MIKKSKDFKVDSKFVWFMACNACGKEAFFEYSRADVMAAAKAAGWANYFRFDAGRDFCPDCANEINDKILEMQKRMRPKLRRPERVLKVSG